MFNFFKGLWKSVTSFFTNKEATVEQKQEATVEQKQEATKFFMENSGIGLSHEEILNFFTNQKVKSAALTFFNDYEPSGKITFAQTVKAFCDEEVIKFFVTDADKKPPEPLKRAFLRHFVEHSTNSNLTWREAAGQFFTINRQHEDEEISLEDAVKIFKETTVPHTQHRANHLDRPDRGPPPPLPPRPRPEETLLPPLPTRAPPPRPSRSVLLQKPGIQVTPPTASKVETSHVAPPPLPPPPSTPHPDAGGKGASEANMSPPGTPPVRRLAPPPRPAPRCKPLATKLLQHDLGRSVSP